MEQGEQGDDQQQQRLVSYGSCSGDFSRSEKSGLPEQVGKNHQEEEQGLDQDR